MSTVGPIRSNTQRSNLVNMRSTPNNRPRGAGSTPSNRRRNSQTLGRSPVRHSQIVPDTQHTQPQSTTTGVQGQSRQIATPGPSATTGVHRRAQPIQRTLTQQIHEFDDDDIDIIDEDDMELNEDEGADEEDDIAYRLLAPPGIDRSALQAIIDKAVQEQEGEGEIGTQRSKRRYDKSRMRGEFSDGGEVWGRLIAATRLNFCRFIHVNDSQIPILVRLASGREIDTTSDAYSKCYDKILEWRKNWFYLYTSAVEALQLKIESDNDGYSGLSTAQLRPAYAKMFSYEAFYGLMGTTCAVVDWRATLAVPRLHLLYKTLFTYSLVYMHLCRHSPTKLSRADAKARIRLIMYAEEYKDLTVDSLILLPPKPPKKVRQRREKIGNLKDLDGDFEPFTLDVPDGENNGPAAAYRPAVSNIDPILLASRGSNSPQNATTPGDLFIQNTIDIEDDEEASQQVVVPDSQV